MTSLKNNLVEAKWEASIPFMMVLPSHLC